MMSLLLALMLAAGPDPNTVRIEAALFLPRLGVALAADPIVVYDASGVVLMPALRAAQLTALFDGSKGRFVVSSATSLAAGPSAVMLPMAAAELRPDPTVNQRANANTAPDLSGLRVDVASAQPLPNGARLGLTLGLTQAAAPQQQTQNSEEMVFSRRQVRTELTLTYEQPFAVLLDSGQGLSRSSQTMRQQIGNQQIEARGALVGVVLHLVQPGQPLAFSNLVPPIAPPGHVRVTSTNNRAGNLIYREGMRVSDALVALGQTARPGAGLSITRLLPNGSLDRYEAASLPLPGANDDLPLRDRDSLVIGMASAKAAPLMPEGMAGGGMPGAGAGGMVAGMAPTGPTAMVPPPAPSTAPGMVPNQQARSEVTRSLTVDELQRLAPSAALAGRAVVALRGLAPGDAANEVLMAGTLVSSDGLCITAPAATVASLANLRAQLADGREVRATILNTDVSSGLALLRLTDGQRPLRGLSFLQLNTVMPSAGTPLLIAGNPLGLVRSVNLTVVAGPRRQLPEAPGAEMQLDAALATGTSGGPIVDLNGRMVAVAYGTLRDGEAGPGVGLAVPADLVARLLGSTRR